MKQPMLIRQSTLTHRWYAFTRYRVQGSAVVVIGQKCDVTDEIEKILAECAKQKPKGRKG